MLTAMPHTATLIGLGRSVAISSLAPLYFPCVIVQQGFGDYVFYRLPPQLGRSAQVFE
tara:strand:- start:195 stop:368 length:174 start_codon:yes stop_codon:yes gene_type:complete